MLNTTRGAPSTYSCPPIVPWKQPANANSGPRSNRPEIEQGKETVLHLVRSSLARRLQRVKSSLQPSNLFGAASFAYLLRNINGLTAHQSYSIIDHRNNLVVPSVDSEGVPSMTAN